ncbi:VRR-NUC domain-containing protein [bacterium]|nr:VRR-NUC domain-containing protein [bacterium]
MKRDRAETILLCKIVAFLHTKTDLFWYFTGPDAYLAVLAKSAHPYMLAVAKKKAGTMGNRAGLPDLCICDSPPAIEGCKGAYIELKVKKNTLSKDQKVCAEELRNRGYHVGIVRDTLDNFKQHLVDLGYVFKGSEYFTSSE